MGHGNRHDDEPPDEHPEGPGPGPGEEPVEDLGGSPDIDLGEESDDDGEPRRRPPLPDPLDRIWLHPTELSVLGAAFAPPADHPVRHRPPAWLAPLLAGAAGALLTVAVLAVTGSFDRSSEPARPTALTRATTPPRTPTAADALARLGP